MILITDAPLGGHDDTYTSGVDDVNAHQIALDATAKGIKIVAIYVPTGGVDPETEAIMKDYAATTGGAYYLAAPDGSGVSQAIQMIIRNCGSLVTVVGGEIIGGENYINETEIVLFAVVAATVVVLAMKYRK
ncbi:MAG: hypothetical protein J7K21_06735 [Desulfurococcales archaeon]|nr:hypothetical protein [Desulfurococcales archaeon]